MEMPLSNEKDKPQQRHLQTHKGDTDLFNNVQQCQVSSSGPIVTVF